MARRQPRPMTEDDLRVQQLRDSPPPLTVGTPVIWSGLGVVAGGAKVEATFTGVIVETMGAWTASVKLDGSECLVCLVNFDELAVDSGYSRQLSLF